jgi:hypothetical protein
MISFLDLFKCERFVATSFAELLFWLLAAVAVLLGLSGVVSGIGQAQVEPAGGLITIALSIVGGLAGIVAARMLCEAVIMVFRANESLLDIRDSLASTPERPSATAQAAAGVAEPAPVPAPVPVQAAAPAAALSFAEVLEAALAEPEPASMMPPLPSDLDWEEVSLAEAPPVALRPESDSSVAMQPHAPDRVVARPATPEPAAPEPEAPRPSAAAPAMQKPAIPNPEMVKPVDAPPVVARPSLAQDAGAVHAGAVAVEGQPASVKPSAPKAAETSSLEARLAEIRARRDVALSAFTSTRPASAPRLIPDVRPTVAATGPVRPDAAEAAGSHSAEKADAAKAEDVD